MSRRKLAPSRAYHHAMAFAAVVHRDDLDSLDVEGMARSRGMSADAVQALVDHEKKRRAAI